MFLSPCCPSPITEKIRAYFVNVEKINRLLQCLFIEIVASPLDLKTPPLEGRDEYQHLKNIQLRKKKVNKNDNIYKNEVQIIGYGIPIEFLSQRKKIIQISPETAKFD